MAEDLIASGAVEVSDGYRLGPVNTSIWPLLCPEPNSVSYRYPAAEGDVFTLSQERGESQIQYGALDAAGDTSALTATVWRGGERLTEQEVAMMGLVAWYVAGKRVATGGTYTCAAGETVECRLEG